jgi:nucleoside-diphosphate kinase
MVKPGFTDSKMIKRIIEILESKGVKMVDFAYINYDEEVARLHYTEKSGKPYFQELVDYLTSDKAFGMIYEGENALVICRDTVEELRKSLPKEFNLKTDVMRNILHCSSKTKVGDEMLTLDTQREIALFDYLKRKKI